MSLHAMLSILGFFVLAGMIGYLGYKLRGRIRHLDQQLRALKNFDKVLENQGRLITEIRAVLKTLSEGQRELSLTTSLTALGFRYPMFFGGWSIDAFLAREVLTILERERPKVVMELGSGLSTVFIATVLDKLGLLDTRHIAIDHLEEYLDGTRRHLELAGYADRVELWLCPLGQAPADGPAWYEGVTERLADTRVDFVLVDGPPGGLHPRSRQPALERLLPYMSEGAVLILDDAIRAEEQAILEAWRQAHPELEITRTGRGHGYGVVSRPKRGGESPKRETLPPPGRAG